MLKYQVQSSEKKFWRFLKKKDTFQITNYCLILRIKDSLSVDLKYYNGLPVIKEIKRVSKPGRRIYARATSIPKIQNGFGLAIVSTPQGVMSDNEARIKNVGGEIICRVF